MVGSTLLIMREDRHSIQKRQGGRLNLTCICNATGTALRRISPAFAPISQRPKWSSNESLCRIYKFSHPTFPVARVFQECFKHSLVMDTQALVVIAKLFRLKNVSSMCLW